MAVSMSCCCTGACHRPPYHCVGNYHMPNIHEVPNMGVTPSDLPVPGWKPEYLIVAERDRRIAELEVTVMTMKSMIERLDVEIMRLKIGEADARIHGTMTRALDH